MPLNSKTSRPRTYHHEALAWRKVVIARSGTVSASTMRAVSNFCKAIDAAGIRSKFLRLNLICGNNLNAARVPLYRGASATGTQYGQSGDGLGGPVVSTDYSEATGLQGNGSSKALSTTITIGKLKEFGTDYGNVHLSVYNRSVAGVAGPSFGAITYAGSGVGINSSGQQWYSSGPGLEFTSGSVDTSQHCMIATTFARGFHLAEFTAAAAGFYGINGASVTVAITNTSGGPFEEGDGTPLYFLSDTSDCSAQLLSAYSCGLPMTTDDNRLAFANAMIAFQAALGRNVT